MNFFAGLLFIANQANKDQKDVYDKYTLAGILIVVNLVVLLVGAILILYSFISAVKDLLMMIKSLGIFKNCCAPKYTYKDNAEVFLENKSADETPVEENDQSEGEDDVKEESDHLEEEKEEEIKSEEDN